MIETGGSHRFMWLCGNFHSKPEIPLYKGLNLPPSPVLSVNQGYMLKRKLKQQKLA